MQLSELDAAPVVDPARQLAVVVKQVPLSMVLDDGMMRCPAEHRLQNAPAVGEGAIRAVGNRVHDVMRGSCRVGQIVLSAEFMHPRAFKIPPLLILRLQRVPVFVQDHQMLRFGFKMLHVLIKLGEHRADRKVIAFGTGSRGIEAAGLPHFKLPAPKPAVDDIAPPVIIAEHSRIDAVASGNIILFRREGTRGIVGNRDTQAENTVMVTGREVKVILSVFACGVRRPHLFADPGDVFHVQSASVIHAGRVRPVHGQDMVVLHHVFAAVVVILTVMGNIVGRINIDLIPENMR